MSQPVQGADKRKRGRPRIHSPRKKASIKGRHGFVLRGQARDMVCALREYFEAERENGGPLIDVNKVVERTAAALKISKATVIRIGKEKEKREEEPREEQEEEEGEIEIEIENVAGPSHAGLETPGKTRNYAKRVTNMDSFQQGAIRRHVYSYYERKEHPTVRKLHSSLRENQLFNGSESSLRLSLLDLGFQFEKYSNRTVLLERPDIVAWRCRYLRSVKNVDYESIVWLDETFVNAGHTLPKGWSDRTPQGTMKAPLGKGGRVIVLHAGTSRGFVANCLLMFRSRKTGDYHEEMNAVCFTEWFKNSLLKNIPPKSTIVMDNAPYHSLIRDRAPTMQCRKADMLAWVQRNILPQIKDITIAPGATKSELMELVTTYKPKPVYVIDELAKSNGHQVIRLPPYHAHFNPIELIWAQAKGYVARNNKRFTITEIERLTREGIDCVTAENWASAVKHTKELVQKQWETEGILDDRVEEIIISLGSGSSSSSSSQGEESDSSLGVAPLTP